MGSEQSLPTSDDRDEVRRDYNLRRGGKHAETCMWRPAGRNVPKYLTIACKEECGNE